MGPAGDIGSNAPGRPLPSEDELIRRGYASPDMVRRREILRETLAMLGAARASNQFGDLAARNVARWREEGGAPERTGEVRVIPGDWGDVALRLTKEHGVTFAVLNMANAFVPGGGYVEGMVAQEENMFRRTDCHFQIGPDEYDASVDQYRPHMTDILSAAGGKVFLDAARPRVCVRGPEDRARRDLGYDRLPDEDVFPFFELRASAQDLRDGRPFDPEEARRRIVAQLDTLREAGVRHAVLGAFGCGAFQNPATEVARLYAQEIDRRRGDFALIAFAIYAAGYGTDNYPAFASALG